MIDDLTMLANLPVVDAEVVAKVKEVTDAAKAEAASHKLPPPTRKHRNTGPVVTKNRRKSE